MMDAKLPWDMIEEILCRFEPLSLIRFKTVCKQWNKLFKTKSFLNNHLVHARTQFLLWNDSKMYSVNVTLNDDPKIEVCEFHSEIPFLRKGIYVNFLPCNGLLFCYLWLSLNKKAAVLNPWLRQTRWIESKQQSFMFGGIGYDIGKHEKGLKIVGPCRCGTKYNDDIFHAHENVDIYKLETNEWKCKCIDVSAVQPEIPAFPVSLNGNLYWILADDETHECFIQSFDFSKEIYKEVLCVLPWDENSYLVLSTFRKDQLSVLKRSIKTNNIEIWVTKNKINNIDDGENITWMKFMSFTVPMSCCYPYNVPSYFIHDDDHKNSSLVMCCKDENKKLCIYIVRGNALTKKIHVGLDANHRSYVPSLMSVPS